MYKMLKGDQLIFIALLHTKKSWDKNVVCYKYNHLLEYFDIIKIYLKMKNTVIAEVTKVYYPSNINKNIRGMKQVANK